MNNWMRIVAKRHQHTDNGLEMQSSCHSADLGMDASQRRGASSASIRLPVLNNGIDEPVDLRIGARIASTVAETAQCLDTNGANNRVRVNDKFLIELAAVNNQSWPFPLLTWTSSCKILSVEGFSFPATKSVSFTATFKACRRATEMLTTSAALLPGFL